MSQSDKNWEPVYSNYPILVYRTKRKLNDWDADDMKFKDESRGKVIDQFNFSIEKHIHYMKQLGSIF
ncbi:hypothetical protein C5F64_05865 [Photobacterium damselae subsp. damselae]|nr:hypothetical protein C5F64_05865 [Photobacterium damselae subsp. damselae]